MPKQQDDISEESVDRAAKAIWECMQNDAWIPTMGVTPHRLRGYIRVAARAALKAAKESAR